VASAIGPVLPARVPLPLCFGPGGPIRPSNRTAVDNSLERQINQRASSRVGTVTVSLGR
jgi:hypothetical protein